MYKNTVALVLKLYYSCHVCLNMNDRAKLECLKLGCVFLASPDIKTAIRLVIQHLRDCYQATRTVKGQHRPGKLRMATDIKTATNVDYIDDIHIGDIRSGWLPTLPDE